MLLNRFIIIGSVCATNVIIGYKTFTKYSLENWDPHFKKKNKIWKQCDGEYMGQTERGQNRCVRNKFLIYRNRKN